MKKYDAIVIGSGQAGTPLSKKLANAGWSTALVEKRWIGGTCINDGCTPTKTLIASAKIARLAAESHKLGVNIPSFRIDMPAILRRKNEIVSRFRSSAEKGLEKTPNLEILYGAARFTGPKIIEIVRDGAEPYAITAESIFINTGTSTRIPDVDGLPGIPYLTATTILDIAEVPEHLLVIGAGYIGLEFAQMFLRFGSRVTMVEASAQLLPKEDRDVAECLEDVLATEGITFYKSATPARFSRAGVGITAVIEHGKETIEVNCSHVLLATGRTPETAELGTGKAGITLNERNFIEVNEYLETSQPGVYAIGDVKGGPAFTHVAYNDHIVLWKNILQGGKVSIKNRVVPYCMFTDPQLGRVGLSETEAIKLGLNIEVAIIPMEHVARAIEMGDTRGMMKAIVDRDSRKILGAAIIGTEGGEIMSVLQLAMAGGITAESIREMMFAHPLYSESLNNLFMKLDK